MWIYGKATIVKGGVEVAITQVEKNTPKETVREKLTELGNNEGIIKSITVRQYRSKPKWL